MGEILAAPGGLNSRQLFYSFRVRHVVWSNGSNATGVASNVMGLLPQGGVYSYGSNATGVANDDMGLMPRCGE